MKTIVTLMIKRALDASHTDSYEDERDEMIEKLQAAGWTVTIDDEEDTDEEDGDEDDSDDDYS